MLSEIMYSRDSGANECVYRRVPRTVNDMYKGDLSTRVEPQMFATYTRVHRHSPPGPVKRNMQEYPSAPTPVS